ncbi:ras-associated and pleckstrin homology domains-containing protein 1 [Drosophila montana]|uniref:ras-associated and pleckstrin homology domains-containing protein 1 n=1 Tax=Drosophila montana TaxID=40370 RepID=UPI00313D64C2
MAEGFKKYFNSTTMNGRANVAKATYATLALVYLFYRVRRGKDQPPAAKEPTLEPSCSCDEKLPHSEIIVEPPDRDCAVCRERRPRDDGCNGHSDPPPPPPPASSAPARRKCPCEDPHRHLDSGKPQHTQHPPTQQQQRQSMNASQLDEAHPARELISQMQEAASRVLRNVIGAVMGDTPSAASGDCEENCSCCTSSAGAPGTATDVLDSGDQVEDEACDYESDSQMLNRQRRTAPRACVPSNTSSDTDDPSETEQPESESEAQSQATGQTQPPSAPQSQPQLQSTTQSQSQPQPPTRYRCFDDDFASEMFFEDYEE